MNIKVINRIISNFIIIHQMKIKDDTIGQVLFKIRIINKA